jgi:hypothetical protein
MNRLSDRGARRARSSPKLDFRALKSKLPGKAVEHMDTLQRELARAFPLSNANETNLKDALAGLQIGRGNFAAALEKTIGDVALKFDEARQELEAAANERDESKWKGEMIAYANVVALLEMLKRSDRSGIPERKRRTALAPIKGEDEARIRSSERLEITGPVV